MLTALLRNRRFVLLWLTQMFVTLGDTLFSLGVMVTVYQRTQSTLQTALVTVATTSPPFLFGPFAGVMVDRYPRRVILVGVNFIKALLVGILFWFLNPETFYLPGVYLVVFMLAITGTLYRPSISATIPSLVERDELVRANSLIMTTNQAIMGLGYIVGGYLLAQLSVLNVIAGVATSYGIATALVALIQFAKRPPNREVSHPPSVFSSIAEGLRYIRGHPLARSLLVMETIEFIPHGLWSSALMLAFTQQALNAGVVEFGYQSAAYFIGQWVGGVIAVVLAARLARRAGWIIISNAFIFGILTLGYATSPNVVWAVVLCFIFGPPAAIDPNVRGRVSATKETLAYLTFTIATVVFAWLSDVIPVRNVVVMGGIIYLLTSVYALLNRTVRDAHIEPHTVQIRSEEDVEMVSPPTPELPTPAR
jgi:DHA3 family macrolide efflux protein-like MFS transporter